LLKASGGAQFAKNALEYIADYLKSLKSYAEVKRIIVVDLRPEFHVDAIFKPQAGLIKAKEVMEEKKPELAKHCFSDNESRHYAVAWKLSNPPAEKTGYYYNHDLDAKEIEELEENLGKSIVGKELTYDTDCGKIVLKASNYVTERHLVAEMEKTLKKPCIYARLPLPDDDVPNDETMDKIIAFIKKREPGDWMHFHCAGGQGRTGIVLSMLASMNNPKKLSADEIIEQQHKLGGIDMKKMGKEAQRELLRLFHQYCQECADFSPLWSKWAPLQRSQQSQ
jgi:hypothetical protein